MVCGMLAGCGLHPVHENFPRYCSVYSHLPCLDRLPQANCEPCPTDTAASAPQKER
jgi:hypothetical protein